MIPIDDIRYLAQLLDNWDNDSIAILRGVYADELLANDLKQAIERVRAWLESVTAMPTPDWPQAPKRANYYAVDADGLAAWFEEKPYMIGGIWSYDDEEQWCEVIGNIELPLGMDWRLTLRRRPKVNAVP